MTTLNDNCLIIPSFIIDENWSQISIFYLSTLLKNVGVTYDILEKTGVVDYYDPPEYVYNDLNKALWLKKELFEEKWIDDYIPEVICNDYSIILCSALFSLDIIFQGRYVKKYKNKYKNCKAIIGGAAVKNLSKEQFKVISSVFDEIYTHDIICTPDYSLLPIKNLITIATGNGCDWGKCRFCCSSKQKYYLRPIDDIVNDFNAISSLSNDTEIMLSSDSIPIKDLKTLANELKNTNNKQKYNLMFRANNRIDKEFSLLLNKSKCSDVFIGVEILDDVGLKVINKGIDVDMIKKSIINLSRYMKIQIGLILFIPNITKKQLNSQLINLEKLLPYIDKIELETLSILNNSYFYNNYSEFDIKLFPKYNLIFDYWCYGLSQDIPWTFNNKYELKMWLDYSDELKKLIGGYVDEKYWGSVDYIKENYS